MCVFWRVEQGLQQREPSSGGTGNRLNSPSTMLTVAAGQKNDQKVLDRQADDVQRQLQQDQINDGSRKLETGRPGHDAHPHLWYFRLYGLVGTGLAQPMMENR